MRRVSFIMLLAGCAGGEASRPGTSDVRLYYYRDDQGLTAATAGARVEHPISPRATVLAQAVLDHFIVVQAKKVHADTGGQPTGHAHDDVDAITSASVTVTGGGRLEKTRIEGGLGARFEGSVAGSPASLETTARFSNERDYRSLAGSVRVAAELFERNTTVSLFAAYGADRSDPIEAPAGEADDWPSTHDRWTAGLSVSQLLSPVLIASGGVLSSWHLGTLGSPYRRALVRTSLFPERLPSTRARYAAFAGIAWYVGWDAAIHLRQGLYLDSWSIGALIPEIRINKELDRALVSIYHRTYLQTAAEFYRTSYEELEEIRTGDARLGRVREHLQGLELTGFVSGRRDEIGAVALGAGYALSLAHYALLERTVAAHVVTLSLSASY
jgi:hypothetical protein